MILVIGGAGYIGSHLVKELVKTNEVVVLDNLSTGHRWAIDEKAVFVEGNLGNEKDLESVFTNHKIDAVMHFAANSLVGESVTDPLKYYQNNVAATLTLTNDDEAQCEKVYFFIYCCYIWDSFCRYHYRRYGNKPN